MKQHTAIGGAGLGLIISLVLCLLCGLMSNLAQTDAGHVTKETLSIESPSGHRLSMDMLQPKSATPSHPAPAIVFAHGGNTNKEKSDDFQIEWPAGASSSSPSTCTATGNPRFSIIRNGW